MTRVTPITHKRDQQLVASIRADLVAAGRALSSADDDVREWRRAARRAGRGLGRPIMTLAMGRRAYAELRDWPASPQEEAAARGQERQLMEAQLFFGPLISGGTPSRRLRRTD